MEKAKICLIEVKDMSFMDQAKKKAEEEAKKKAEEASKKAEEEAKKVGQKLKDKT